MLKALIIYIQKYSIHDGDGIRTVIFFKGCPLSCTWCHNPESRSFDPQLIYNKDKCTLCLACISSCPENIVYFDEKAGSLNSLLACTSCGACTEACLYGAREIVGKAVSVKELMKEIEKDAMFYEQSGGGVTLSGGEVMAADMDFIEELLKHCHKLGYPVNIDTCGYAPFADFQRILEYVDVFLYDIKFIDSKKHRQFTGQDNELILNNLVKLNDAGAKIYIRIPLIEGINSSDADMDLIIDFMKPLNIKRLYLLPYHRLGRHKAERIGLDVSDMAPPSADRLGEIKDKFQEHGYQVKIGG